uniref:Uncharacterized protein n=1 Tax=Cyclophora tenuis TaxID=216820 RepID=A0A7S1DBP5_CYCTE
MMMRAVGYDSDFGTDEIKRIFFTTAEDGNEFDGDVQIHNAFATLGTQMNAAITNATMDITSSQLSDVDQGGHTRVVSTTYSEKVVGPGWVPGQSIGAPTSDTMQSGDEMQQKTLKMAREAAALQQSVLSELLQMDEDERDSKLEKAKEVHDNFIKQVSELPPGPERVSFMTGMDPSINRQLLMYKLWTNMLQANGGNPPKVNFLK